MARGRRRARSTAGSVAPLLMVLVLLSNPFGLRDALVEKAMTRLTDRLEHRMQPVVDHLETLQEPRPQTSTVP